MLLVLIRIAQAILMSTHNTAILVSTHNISFYGELTEIILELSLNTLLICSTDIKGDHGN